MIATLALTVVVGIAFFIPELGLTKGQVHPQFSSMRQGGVSHSNAVILLGWAFGLITLVLIFFMCSLGVARQNDLRGLGRPLVIIFALTAVAWTAAVVAYHGYISNPDQALAFGFPLPTALIIFVLPPVMVLINVLFVVRYPKSIMDEDDIKKFNALLNDKDESE